MASPFGIDISQYQYSQDGTQKPDFDLVNRICDFVAVRAGMSWGYVDPQFNYSWQCIVRPRLAYHVVYPGESASRQMDHFLNIVKPGEHDRLALDMELDHGYGKTKITHTLLECLEHIRENTGRYPVIYSRSMWVNAFLNVSALPQLDWWLAQYLYPLPFPAYTPEKTPPPLMPNGVSNWLIQQTGEKGNGSAVGVVSHYVDCNRWNGTKEEMLAYFGLGEETPPEPDPDPDPIRLFDAKVVTTPPIRLKTRYTPAGKERPEGDWLQSQEIVPVYETHATGWWRVEEQAWSSADWLKRLDYVPPTESWFAYYGAIFSQRDVRWKNHSLGTRSTIGAHGCLMTCASMVCNALGHATNPLALDEWLTAHDGYHEGNLFLWAKIEELYPDMHFDGFVSSPSMELIRLSIMAGTLPIMFVDYDDTTPMIEMHWLLGIGVFGNEVIVADPLNGVIGNLSEMYPKAVIRLGSYSKI